MARRAPSEAAAIVVGTDFSATAANALARAAEIARAQRAALHVVHAAPPLPRTLARRFFGGKDEAVQQATWTRVLAGLCPTRVEVHTHVVAARPVKALEAHARSVRAALIVVGARGRTLPDALIGSTAERLAATAGHPVLLVRNPVRRAYRSVIVAADVRTDVGAVVAAAKVVAPDAGMQVVHGYEALFEATLLLHGADAEDLRSYRAQARKEARDTLLPRLRAAGLAAGALVLRHGDPRHVLVREDRRAKDGLLVLNRGRSVLKHAVLGSVSRTLVEHGTRDVLLV